MSQVLPIRHDVAMPGDAPAVGAAPRATLLLGPMSSAAFADPDGALARAGVEIETGGLVSRLIAAPRHTDVLIVEIDPENAQRFAEFEHFVREDAGPMLVIAAVRDLSVAATRKVLRAGAADVLPLPFTTVELAAAIEPARSHGRAARAEVPAKKGRVVTFLGALGGVGTTAIATQAGILWAANDSVCLIDLDVQFGNAALYLDLRPKLTLTDVIDSGDRLDPDLLKAVAERHSSGLSVIAGPPDMVPLDALSPELVQHTLGLAVQVFDIVLVDLPGAWTNWSLTALDRSDLACLVTGLTVPGIHQARRQLDVIEANGLTDRFRVVVNRIAAPMFGKVDLRETEGVLGRRIDYAICNDYPTVSQAIDQGKPFSAIKGRSRVVKDLMAMVAGLSAALGEATKVRA